VGWWDYSRQPTSHFGGQTQRRLFRSVIDSVAASLAADFAFLSARFSFKDFPDFLDIACRGDLSDTAGPLFCGGLVGPDFPDHTPGSPRAWMSARGQPYEARLIAAGLGCTVKAVGNPATPGCVSRLDR
jgi:hypothetical protein